MNIIINSDIIGDFSTTTEVKATVGFNCCADTEVVYTMYNTGSEWLVRKSGINIINSIIVEVDGIQINLLSGSMPLIDLFTINSAVNSWISNQGHTGLFLITENGGVFTLSFTGVSGFVPISAFNTEIFTITDNEEINAAYNKIVISPKLFGLDSFKDGVYSGTFTIKNDLNEIITQSFCYFYDEEVKCKIVNYYIDNPTSNAYQLYETIKWAIECGSCSCGDVCDLYKELYRLIYAKTLKDSKHELSFCKCK